MKTYLDWSAYDTYGVGDAYAGIPATGGQYAKAVAVCMNNHQCQRDGKGVMCPSYRVTRDPAHSTGARVKAFKAALNGELGENPFAADELAAAMDLCVSCKGCKKECPSAVDMTLIKTEYLAQRNARIGLTARQKLFGALPRWLHRHRQALIWLARWRNCSPRVAKLAERWLGIAAARPIPGPAAQPYVQPALGTPPATIHGEPGKTSKTVILFVDTFTHHFNPEVAEAALKVLQAGGYGVRVLQPAPDDDEPDRPLCCGRSYLSQGMVDAARVEAQRVMKALAPALAEGLPVIGLEPSCLLALRDEFYSLSLGPAVGQLGKQAFLLEEFLMREGNKGLKLDLKPLAAGKAVVHGHCHQKAFGTMKAMKKVLGWIPEFDFEIVDASCCGMSGSFGMESEHYKLSQAMGELALLPAVRGAGPDAAVIANGFSCRHQIHDGTGRQAEHIALLLARALK